ncbi:MAG TPA: D-aminoacyl-tRNA deacylase [Bacteroidales bacterium]|nr:D-aminoacyl-tRNA deacylase [Bacteroidales bacterium]
MRAVIQRVSSAKVEIDKTLYGAINQGLLILVGFEESDNQNDIDWISTKIVQMRIFSDDAGLMNKSILDIDGNILLISQFTLFGQIKKGNRPSFIKASRPEKAIPLYESLQEALCVKLQKTIQTGVFGADMKVSLTNDGPVTLLIDTKNKE